VPADIPEASTTPDVSSSDVADATSTGETPAASEPCPSNNMSQSGSGTNVTVGADIPPGNGLLVGRVQRSGADPRSGAGGTGLTAPVSGDPIEIRDVSGTVVARPVSAQDGTFQVMLPVAVYMVTEDILGTSQCADVQNQSITTITFALA
jgi:hypothetical protein